MLTLSMTTDWSLLWVGLGCDRFVCKMGARGVMDNGRVATDMTLVIVAPMQETSSHVSN